MSGIRKEPPISTSSPREVMTSPPGGEGGEGQQNRCRVVVDHQRRLRAGKAAQQGLHMGIPLSPPAGGQVVFQRGITAGNVLCRPQCAAAQSSPPQIGMKHHAGCVDDAAEGRKPGAPAGFRDLGAEGFLTGQLRDRAGENVFPQGVQRSADSLRHRRRRELPPPALPARGRRSRSSTLGIRRSSCLSIGTSIYAHIFFIIMHF